MYEEDVAERNVASKKLQDELDEAVQAKAKYAQAVELNANQVRELQARLREQESEFQRKLDQQSKFGCECVRWAAMV